jgi:hypothetical protein
MIVVNARGGVRWSASFDAHADLQQNPWGVLPWSEIVQRGAAPAWGFSRMLVQRPLSRRAVGVDVRPYLASSDPADYNVSRPTLQHPGWRGARLPSYADVASEVAMARVKADPGGPFVGDHRSAQHLLGTGYREGRTGIVTAAHQALQRRRVSGAEGLPAVAIGQSAFSLAGGEVSAARPLVLRRALDLAGPGAAAGPRLADPALRLAAPSTGDTALGALVDGGPLTNGMLAEVFGLGSALTPPGDILFDAFGAAQGRSDPTWKAAENDFGLQGALAVRLLQLGAPLVTLAVGGFDTHTHEALDPTGRHSHAAQVVELARMLAALRFTLGNVADPGLAGRSLWDTTAIVVCSEFGRSGVVDGFNGPAAGSSHDPWSAWPVLGGPIAAGGRVLADPRAEDGAFHQNRVFSSILQSMGVDGGPGAHLPLHAFPPIPGLLEPAPAAAFASA